MYHYPQFTNCFCLTSKDDERIQSEKFTQTMATHMCDKCVTMQEENRLLRNKLVDENHKLIKEKKITAELRSSKLLGLELI